MDRELKKQQDAFLRLLNKTDIRLKLQFYGWSIIQHIANIKDRVAISQEADSKAVVGLYEKLFTKEEKLKGKGDIEEKIEKYLYKAVKNNVLSEIKGKRNTSNLKGDITLKDNTTQSIRPEYVNVISKQQYLYLSLRNMGYKYKEIADKNKL